jgi:hypothetical protein
MPPTLKIVVDEMAVSFKDVLVRGLETTNGYGEGQIVCKNKPAPDP